MNKTRKSTPKYEIVTLDMGVVVFGPASKTECINIASRMNHGRKVVAVKPMTRALIAA